MYNYYTHTVEDEDDGLKLVLLYVQDPDNGILPADYADWLRPPQWKGQSLCSCPCTVHVPIPVHG